MIEIVGISVATVTVLGISLYKYCKEIYTELNK